MKVKFTHTNIISKDWQKLAQFYIEVFGCQPVYPERDLNGDWIDRVTGMKDVRIRGIHLRLPGYADGGPTLEIFQYSRTAESSDLPAINKVGFSHIAFLVEDVRFYFDRLLANGGSTLGELVEKEIDGVGVLTVVYARDPEGNIIEIQNWK
ncbi:MAG: glyoxalase [Peptococcaceae bacterium BICA1-7]|nr:MAG: glyoxalase [Peptococcaceae bacterium BICA1-7]HBV98594.1 glyoxalase/bleomycin resistance/dioxygenase family protein [Desulfotomaculum sp.]